MINCIVNAGRTNQLAYDNSLRTVDYKGTGFCHQRKITHKDLMFADLFLLLIVQTNCNGQRSSISSISFLAFFNRIFHIVLVQFKVYKLQTQGSAVVSNRRDIIEHLF